MNPPVNVWRATIKGQAPLCRESNASLMHVIAHFQGYKGLSLQKVCSNKQEPHSYLWVQLSPLFLELGPSPRALRWVEDGRMFPPKTQSRYQHSRASTVPFFHPFQDRAIYTSPGITLVVTLSRPHPSFPACPYSYNLLHQEAYFLSLPSMTHPLLSSPEAMCYRGPLDGRPDRQAWKLVSATYDGKHRPRCRASADHIPRHSR
jgi:hypothetical protein